MDLAVTQCHESGGLLNEGEQRLTKHVAIGVGAALLLLAVYVGVVSLAEDFQHAVKQASGLWYWMLPLAGGFGIQAGLFSFIRDAMRQRRAAATASATASGGVSTGSMLACCAHHLSDALPLLGLSGAAAFLAEYQSVFMIAGVLSNVVGIALMLEVIQRHGLSSRLALWKYDMTRIRKGTTVLAGLVFIAVVAINFIRPVAG